MLKQIKQELISNPQAIINILQDYDFNKPKLQNNEIRFGYGEGHNSAAIRIKLTNNDNLFVTDFVRDIVGDIFSYIVKARKVNFVDVLNDVKAELGIEDFCIFTQKSSIFGGFYERISCQNSEIQSKVYPESVLNHYQSCYCTRFLRDRISYEAQDKFEIGYDIETQRITIPIRNTVGEIIGIKGRANWEVSGDEPKYYYILPCPMSSTLYGYCQNYEYLVQNDILIFEAEKSVLQCYSYGIRNCVSLGNNSLSETQCRLLMELSPKRIIFMLDKGLPFDNTLSNISKLQKYLKMSDTTVWWWDWSSSSLSDKSSPSDYGKEMLMYIINNELKEINYEQEMECEI